MVIRVESNRYQAQVDGRTGVETALSGPSEGGIGSELPGPGALPTAAGAPGIRWVRVRDLQTGAVLLESDFRGVEFPCQPAMMGWRRVD